MKVLDIIQEAAVIPVGTDLYEHKYSYEELVNIMMTLDSHKELE